MILGFGILSIAHFWPEILRIKVIAKKYPFCLNFWQLSDTKGKSLPYDKKMSNPLLITKMENMSKEFLHLFLYYVFIFFLFIHNMFLKSHLKDKPVLC